MYMLFARLFMSTIKSWLQAYEGYKLVNTANYKSMYNCASTSPILPEWRWNMQNQTDPEDTEVVAAAAAVVMVVAAVVETDETMADEMVVTVSETG